MTKSVALVKMCNRKKERGRGEKLCHTDVIVTARGAGNNNKKRQTEELDDVIIRHQIPSPRRGELLRFQILLLSERKAVSFFVFWRAFYYFFLAMCVAGIEKLRHYES